MKRHYKPPPRGKPSVATAAVIAMMVAGGVYAAWEHAPNITLPTRTVPDAPRSSAKSEPLYTPSSMPKATDPAPRSRTAIARQYGAGIYRCVEANDSVTYSDAPCADGKLVDTKPTSSGFSENWSISVKQR
ncbi:MAG: hypothetical protein ABJA83_13355 [Burkholderiaceae bacterium]